ncbi:response regulator transcription factor [Haloplanus litoreus]|uniref:Response regulator transcription factor n=1 Tax=Haloplanus litoreus TaxID=767515 RepID=A0ABD6A473_9EURY
MSTSPESGDSQTTVLVLEDEEGLADLYTVWLSDEYSVRTAYTAAEARDKFDQDVDIALIDRRLPDESGDAVLDWISRNYPKCRQAMVTAVNPDIDIVEMPLDDYLVKPIQKDELLKRVRRLDNQRNYEGAVRDLYALTRKRVHLESELSESERSSSEEFAWLETRIEELEQTAAEVNGKFDDRDFLEIARRLGDDTGGDSYGE